jgi:tetratricopeptide (TPR) repeat protein
VQARPYNASGWIERIRFHIVRGQTQRAIADSAGAIRFLPDNLRIRHCQALLLLSQGDQAGLRRACSDLLSRYGMMRDPLTSMSVAWCCVLGSDACPDPEGPVRLAETALAGCGWRLDLEWRDRSGQLRALGKPDALNALGASLYRAAHFEASIRCLKEGILKRNGESLPQDWVFLALAHHQLGHRSEALRWLDRFQTYKANEKPDAFWNELEIRLLRQEAEARILFDPVFPDDLFAQ